MAEFGGSGDGLSTSTRVDKGSERRRGPESYGAFAQRRLEAFSIQQACTVNRRDPDYQHARTSLQSSFDRATQEQKDKIDGIRLLGTDSWLDLQAQIRNPATRYNLVDSVKMAMNEESEYLKQQEVVSTDVLLLGNGIHTTVAASIYREQHPDIGILAIGEGTVFDISNFDAWQTNTPTRSPFNEEYEQEGFKVHPDMNHLPGLPIQAREMDARLHTGNTAIGDAVTLSAYLAAQNVFGVRPEGSFRLSTDPRYKYELTVVDTKTNKRTTVRCNDFKVAGGFGETDWSKVGDAATQQLIQEELAQQEVFMKYINDGTLPPGATSEPKPASIILGIEHGYPMFGRDRLDPQRDFRGKDILVVGGGGPTGMTMLMNLMNVSNPQPGFDLDPHGDQKIYAGGLKAKTRAEFLQQKLFPIYLSLGDALPMEEGGDGAILPISEHITSLKKGEDGKITFFYKDPRTGEEKSHTVDMVIIASGMKSTVNMKELFAEIPGFREGTLQFSSVEEGNITQRLGEENIELYGATAAEIEPKVVSLRESQLMPWPEGATAPVIVRTIGDTAKAARLAASRVNPDSLTGPTEILATKKEIPVVDARRLPEDQKDRLYVPISPWNGGVHSFSPTTLAYKTQEHLGVLGFPSTMSELTIRVKPPQGNNPFELVPDISCEDPQVSGSLEGFFRNPLIQRWLTAFSSHGRDVMVKMPIVEGKIDPLAIQVVQATVDVQRR